MLVETQIEKARGFTDVIDIIDDWCSSALLHIQSCVCPMFLILRLQKHH